MNEDLTQSLINAAIALLVAVGVDLGFWQDARQKARKAGKPLPNFDFKTAWPRYFIAFVGAFAGSMSGENPFV